MQTKTIKFKEENKAHAFEEISKLVRSGWKFEGSSYDKETREFIWKLVLPHKENIISVELQLAVIAKKIMDSKWYQYRFRYRLNKIATKMASDSGIKW